jgi:hypothetical protein
MDYLQRSGLGRNAWSRSKIHEQPNTALHPTGATTSWALAGERERYLRNMKAHISPFINANENTMWEALQRTSSLVYITSPFLNFKSLDERGIPEIWDTGEKYAFRISAFYILPLGRHYILVKKIDSKKKEILSSESGTLTKEWNYLLLVEEIDENKIKYTDDIEIKAGALTLFVWLFAHIFYRYRQRRWKKLIAR